jgi:glycosyltransferase involved in cell wall biosynthesis
MVFPLLRLMKSRGVIGSAHWVSLNSKGPERVVIDGITLYHVFLGAEKMKGYGYTKEVIWNALHGILQNPASISQILWQDEFSDYSYYNRLSSELIMKLDRAYDFDLFYIHDFQQLPVGHMLHTLKPKIFRWHIPFDESMIPREWRGFLSTYLNSYDEIIVSSKKYLRSLNSFGYTGRASYVYPYVDPSSYVSPSKEEVEQYCQRFGIKKHHKVVLVVARLDPMKGQDKVIEAIAKVSKNVPEVKLVLVGNGSFSSSKNGVGLSKADKWFYQLKTLAKKLELEERVVFTGHLSQSELNAAYVRSDVTVLPSVREGFGLVVIESWLFHKPTILTKRAGISELVEDGRNGLLFDPEDTNSLAENISLLLLEPERARILGENGFLSSKQCTIEQGLKAESEVIIGLT